MRTTMHRPKPGNATPHDLDFLAGIDIAAEHRRPRFDKRVIVFAAIAAFLLLAAIAVTVLVTGDTATVPDGSLGTTSMERDIAPTSRPGATDLIVLDTSGLDAVPAPEAGPAAETFSPPAATDQIVPDLSGLDPGPAAGPVRTWEPDPLTPQ
jgi:hypothetical protein